MRGLGFGILTVYGVDGFDGGTGLGALVTGALATSGSFPMVFAVLAAGCAVMALVWSSTGAERTA
jgi:hypothetical protein